MTHCLQIRPQRQNETDKECHSFSLIYANGERSLDLVIFVIYTRCIYIYISAFCFPMSMAWLIYFLTTDMQGQGTGCFLVCWLESCDFKVPES